MSKSGTPRVALDARQLLAHVAAGGERGAQRLADPFDAGEVDLGFGHMEGDFAARGARTLAGDPARAGLDLAREGRIGQHRNAQAVAARIARGLGLAGGRARAGATLRVPAIGEDRRETCGTGRAGAVLPPAGK